MTIHIYDLALGDMVTHAKHGVGKVIQCTEKPSVKVKFTNGKTVTLTEKEEGELV